MGLVVLRHAGIEVIVANALAVQVDFVDTPCRDAQACLADLRPSGAELRTQHGRGIAAGIHQIIAVCRLLQSLLLHLHQSQTVLGTAEVADFDVCFLQVCRMANAEPDIAHHRKSDEVTTPPQRIEIFLAQKCIVLIETGKTQIGIESKTLEGVHPTFIQHSERYFKRTERNVRTVGSSVPHPIDIQTGGTAGV